MFFFIKLKYYMFNGKSFLELIIFYSILKKSHRFSKRNQIDIISNRLMIFAGIIMYLFGIVGNILNIWVFTIWSRSPKGPHKRCKDTRTSMVVGILW
jgi:hypothetical protein